MSDNESEAPQNERGASTQERMLAQGPWDQVRTAEMLKGAASLPMPVKIAAPHTLSGCFNHLKLDGSSLALEGSPFDSNPGKEQYYDVPFVEYDKGVIYADRRLDLCKMVLGPLNIDALMDSLEGNTFIRHFLLGNNIIGPAGARRIARFIRDHPDRMDTWYLAGNCIDTIGLKGIVDSILEKDSLASNIWLKRNPLGQDGATDVARLIIGSSHLDTLDLDQTELGDEGVAEIFNQLYHALTDGKQLQLLHIYLNGTGVGEKASKSISHFLGHPSCQLESLFISNNPIGDTGAQHLTTGLSTNVSLTRFMAASIGLTSTGATPLLSALASHPRLTALDLGQSFATLDLGSRYNYISGPSLPSLVALLRSPTLRHLVIDHLAISQPDLNVVYTGIISSPSLCWVKINSIMPTVGAHEVVQARLQAKSLAPMVRARLQANVRRLYGGMEYAAFEAGEKRWLASPREQVRKIDSVYRNRDAGLARRGMKKLEKWWEVGDGTLEEVMAS